MHRDEPPARVFRRAEPSDIDELMDICRECFPRSLRWRPRGPLARQWWGTVIASKAGETWVCSVGDRLQAFCVLVIDEAAWGREKATRCGSAFAKALGVAAHPCLAGGELRKRAGARLASLVRRGVSPVAPASHERRTWLELLAVAPAMRGQGLAKDLLQLCEGRTRELERSALALHVERDNAPARQLYLHYGFACTTDRPSGHILTKSLNS